MLTYIIRVYNEFLIHKTEKPAEKIVYKTKTICSRYLNKKFIIHKLYIKEHV